MCGCSGTTHLERPSRAAGPARVDDDMRASQAERDAVVESLRAHAGEGRLEVHELEDRVERALGARTRGELAALEADLPAPGLARRRSRRASGLRAGVLSLGLLLPLTGLVILLAAPAALGWVGWTALGVWFFAGPPASMLGMGSCSGRRRRHRRAAPA